MAIHSYDRNFTDAVSRHFRVSEFACHGTDCACTACKIDDALIAYLEKIREHFDAPVYISSGYRCPTHNAAVGGASRSYHMRGQAADITVSGVEPIEVARYAESIGILGIGHYDAFVHIDTRAEKSFWYSSAQLQRETFCEEIGKEKMKTEELPTLKRGERSDTVRAAQILLEGYGYFLQPYGADGNFGTMTEQMVGVFQRDHALDADGVIGVKTWKKLLGMKGEN